MDIRYNSYNFYNYQKLLKKDFELLNNLLNHNIPETKKGLKIRMKMKKTKSIFLV